MILDLIWFFIPGILILGIMTSYTDIKYGKIRNKAVIFGLVYAILIHLFVIFVLKAEVNQEYIYGSLLNLLFALILGFVMWYVGVWTAGDSKLFLAFTALVPLFLYDNGFALKPMNILVNTFFPAFVYYFFKIIIKTSWEEKEKAFRETFRLKVVAAMMIALFVFLWLDRLMIYLFGSVNFFLNVFLIFVLFVFLERIFTKKVFWVMVFVAAIRLIVDTSVYSVSFLKMFILYTLLFLFFRLFLLNLSFFKLTKVILISSLKEGMMLAETMNKDKKKYVKAKAVYFSFFDYLKKHKGIFDLPAEGLQKKDILKLKRISKNSGIKKIRIQETVPFAPFLFFGTILTIISKGNFVFFVSYYTIIFLNRIDIIGLWKNFL